MAKELKPAVLAYTDKEKEAIKLLAEKRGTKFRVSELGVASGTLTSIMKKADKFAGDPDVVIINKEKVDCPHCGKYSYTLYWMN